MALFHLNCEQYGIVKEGCFGEGASSILMWFVCHCPDVFYRQCFFFCLFLMVPLRTELQGRPQKKNWIMWECEHQKNNLCPYILKVGDRGDRSSPIFFIFRQNLGCKRENHQDCTAPMPLHPFVVFALFSIQTLLI